MTRATSSRSRPRRSTGERRTDPHEVLAVRAEVDRGRDSARTGAQRQGRRPAGQRRLLAEELDLDPVAGEVAVAEQADDPVVAAAPAATPRAASGPSGTTSMPIARRTSREPLEQLGRLDRLRPRPSGGSPRPASQAAAKSQPPRCGSARITPVARIEPGVDVLEPDRGDAVLDRAAARRGEPEQLEPVAAVRGERVRDGSLERDALRVHRRSPAGGCARRCAGDHRTTVRARDPSLRAIGVPTADGTAFATAAPSRYARYDGERARRSSGATAAAGPHALRRPAGRPVERHRLRQDSRRRRRRSGPPVARREEAVGGRAGPTPGATP